MAGQSRSAALLAGWALAVSLVISRLGLVVHELVGHGGAARLLGGRVDEVCELWDSAGNLVGQATQLAAIRFDDPSSIAPYPT